MNKEELKSAIEKNPLDAKLWFELGNAMDVVFSYETQKDYNEKQNCYQKAFKIDPMFKEAFYEYAKTHETKGNNVLAKYYYEKVKQLDPDWRGIDVDIERTVKLEDDMLERSIKYHEEGLIKDPDNPEKIKQYAHLLGDKGFHDKAISLLEYALELNPKLPETYYFLALQYIHIKDYKKAIECFWKTVEIESWDDEIYRIYEHIADCYSEMGDFNNTLKYYDKTLKYYPAEFKPDHLLGTIGFVYVNMENYDKAIEIFQKILDLNPDVFYEQNAYTYIGEAYAFKGDYESAKSYFEKAVHLRKDSDRAFFGLGYACFHLKEYDLAELSYTMALQANHLHERANHNLGLTYAIQGNFQKAIEYYELALKVKPDQKETYRNLSYAYAKVSEDEKSEACLMKFLELGGDPEDLLNPKEK